MKKVAVVTTTRAEYGLLVPLMQRIVSDNGFELDLIVTGTHLSDRHGYTIDSIINDGFHISHRIDILEDDNTPYGVSLTMANAIRGFAECFRDDRPDVLVILGDRTEMLGVASAAMNEQIPIAHIHGGELTEGAVDDCVRHALTKMSHLHFTATEEYKQRVIQMGEEPDRVFNVGALGAENILNLKLMPENEIRADIGIPVKMPYVMLTYHPETLGTRRMPCKDESQRVEDVCEFDEVAISLESQIVALCDVVRERNDLFFVVTGANADVGGDRINKLLGEFCKDCSNACFIQSLGTLRYLSAVKYASFLMGNSSSGILEAPVLGTPTINIGDRQKGRLRAETVVDCSCTKEDILHAVSVAAQIRHIKSTMFGNGTTSAQIIYRIRTAMTDGGLIRKHFYEKHG